MFTILASNLLKCTSQLHLHYNYIPNINRNIPLNFRNKQEQKTGSINVNKQLWDQLILQQQSKVGCKDRIYLQYM